MRRLVTLSALGLALSGAVAAEVLRHEIDVRAEGAAADGFVLFSWRAPDEGGGAHAALAVGGAKASEQKPDAAYGLRVTEEGKEVGAIKPRDLGALRAEPAGTLLVTVDGEQRAAVAELIAEWSSTRFELPADQVCENLVYRVIRVLDLEAPYRSGFAAGDPFALFRDLTLLNRP